MAKGRKKIDNWTVNHDGQTAEIIVYMRRDVTGEKSGATFRAECLDLDIQKENPNIEELRRDAIAAVKTALTREFGEFFFVQYNGTGRESDHYLKDGESEYGGTAAASVKISAEKLWLTTDTSKDVGATVNRHKKSNRDGRAQAWQENIGEKSYSYGDNSALIPDTPENRAGLRRIFAGFEELSRQLAVLLDTEVIESNLKILAAPGGRLLNAGPAEPADFTKEK